MFGASQKFQVTQFMKKKNMILLTEEWRKDNPTPPKEMPNPASIASRSNSNVKKQPQAQNMGKGKAPATKPYSQRYRMPWKIFFRWKEQLWNYRKRRKPDQNIRNDF
ncbi:hypothetical protein O181_057608 [Austropuccinia psidii MF-1]|uniref:Uncharacterized protein n=1 Tax=Austropuccinia psidii MF-1 TaxID=1389203 RepID=A0A9Q3EBK5_9BASI|nr:hypothetical protein [Austropuccinia psidii MF-1]